MLAVRRTSRNARGPNRKGFSAIMKRIVPIRMLVVLGDGGHTTEMIELLKLLGPNYEYSYMMSTLDTISEGKIPWEGPMYRVPVPLGKHASERNLISVMRSSLKQLGVLLRVRPQVILSTGSSIALPISACGRLLGVKVIHVETGSRVRTMSSTGKMMYRIAHLFFVQWEPLQKDYPKAIYAGRLL
jgi:beta-1,4-N-acetylglucosaminyltransferase